MAHANPPAKPVILVVEDEPLLRLNAIDIIQQAGYDAVEADNADEACRILETRTDIRIVFSDIDMPGSLDGLKLAAVVRRRWPPIELILTSGHIRPAEADLPLRGRFFPKPYQAEQLLSAIHGLLRSA